MKAALAAVVLLPLAAHAEQQLVTQRYTCDRGVDVPVAYVTAGDASVAVLTVEGRQIALHQEAAASGVRYGWPSDGSNYVWWTKGDTATLLWKDGETGRETPLLVVCRAQ